MRSIVQNRADANQLLALKYPGFEIINFTFTTARRLIIEISPTSPPICPRCLNESPKVHDRTWREVRDTPLINCEEVIVRFRIRRVRCRCGCHQCEKLSWLEPKARLTNAFVGWLQAFLRLRVSISDIVRLTGLSWDTVKEYDKLQLKYLFGSVDLSSVRHLAIDEFSLHKGHRYATVIMDIEQRRVIWVGIGKTQKSVQPFFDDLHQKGLSEQIESVSCDMNVAYPKMVKKNLPNAKILYDLFHVIKNFTSDVLVEAKKDTIAQIRNNTYQSKGNIARSTAKIKELNGVEWILVRQQQALCPKKQELLTTLIQDNQLLAALYPVAQMIRDIWKTKITDQCQALLANTRQLLLDIATKFQFKPARKFAQMLKRREEGIINNGFYGFSTNRLEGANNKIKVAKRVAYGYRDFEYFSLKIKAALPGIKYSPWTDFEPGQAILKTGLWKCCFPANS